MPLFGVLAEFKTPADLYAACERVRDAGYTRWDAHSPFPVHGLDGAMGMRRSRLPWIMRRRFRSTRMLLLRNQYPTDHNASRPRPKPRKSRCWCRRSTPTTPTTIGPKHWRLHWLILTALCSAIERLPVIEALPLLRLWWAP